MIPLHSSVSTSSQFWDTLNCQLFTQVITVAVILCKYSRWIGVLYYIIWGFLFICRSLILASNLPMRCKAFPCALAGIQRVRIGFWTECEQRNEKKVDNALCHWSPLLAIMPWDCLLPKGNWKLNLSCLAIWGIQCKMLESLWWQAGHSSVGRASDCRFLQLSDGPWFDSGWPDLLGATLAPARLKDPSFVKEGQARDKQRPS